MTTLKVLKAQVTTFKIKVTTLVVADKTGGPTWKLVQQTAQAVPAALLPQIGYIEAMMKSKDTRDRKKIPGYFKTMKAQWDVIKIDTAKKYSAQHGVGGTKSRTAGIRGLLSTTKTQQAEANRVALADLMIQQYLKLDKVMDSLKQAGDLDDLEGV